MYKIKDSDGIEHSFKLGDMGSDDFFPSQSGSFPAKLSKYYGISEYSINSLINGHIYVSALNELNDIFESLFKRIKLDRIDFKDVFEMLKKIGGTNKSYKDDKRMFDENPNTYYEDFIKSYIDYLNIFVGCFCTTSTLEDDLMWAHYSQNEGFLIEYETNELNKVLNKPHRVLYLDNKNHSMFPNTQKEFAITLFINLLIKKVCWKYENEFRYLIFSQGNPFKNRKPFPVEPYIESKARRERLIEIDKKCISKIILGFHFFQEYKISKYGNSEFNFEKDEKGILKSKLLNYVLENSIKTMMIVIDTSTFNLIPRDIKIKKVGEYKFSLY